MNFLIVINQELNYEKNILFNNKELCDHLYSFIALTSRNLIFSYCIELDEKNRKENYGKIISEILLDLFLAIPGKYFKKEIFIHTFTRKKEKSSTFFIIDINKERLKKNKSNINNPELERMKKFHTILLNDNSIRKKYFVQGNIIYKIEETNYTIYFLAKCFLYLKSDIINEKKEENENKEKKKALNELIDYLANDLFNLYTKFMQFYAIMDCGFPLYDTTKRYFELNVLSNLSKKDKKGVSELFKYFFERDFIIIIKDEYNLEYCYASRLYNYNNKKEKPLKIKNNKKNETKFSEHKSEKHSDNSLINNKATQNISITISDNIIKESSNNKSKKFLENYDIINQIKEEKKKNKINEIKTFNHSFELIKENLTILNPRNFFLKKIFSDIFKDIMFKNKSFICIKNIYINKFGNKIGLIKESKQIDYPTKQKNYSNFLEPKIFLKKDFNFFDKIYFPISFQYLPKSFTNKSLVDIYFYKHQFKFKKEKLNEEMIHICELVTNQYIYFGKIYIFKNI